ncbi:MAG: (2Fe-2S) ferredoxin domain-containing protein [Deltaproteobacteria bacterium]|nr:(2Fe-2S) ferredoxin domain-containing protein [Deltaproteobacteria bacterium]
MRYTHHVFICAHERPPGTPKGDCASKGAFDLISLFKEALHEHGLSGSVRAQKAGCLDLCGQGPSVVVYPEGVFYARVKPEDVKTIVEEHLVGGKPVERLLAVL